MKIKYFIISLIIIFASSNVIFGDVTLPRSVVLEFTYLSKELPVYKFKDNNVGNFLDEYCDSCANLTPFDHTTLSHSNPSFILKQAPNGHGKVGDYICIYSRWGGVPLLNLAQGVIQTSNGHICILTDIDDDFIQTLQLLKTPDYRKIEMPDIDMPMMTAQIGILSLFFIPSNTDFNIINIFVNGHPVQEFGSPRLDWFKHMFNQFKPKD